MDHERYVVKPQGSEDLHRGHLVGGGGSKKRRKQNGSGGGWGINSKQVRASLQTTALRFCFQKISSCSLDRFLRQVDMKL